MAKTNAILTEDRSAAGPVALVVLCALALVQSGLVMSSVWSELRPDSPANPVAVPAVAMLTTAAPAPAPLAIGSLPPLPASATVAPLPAPVAAPAAVAVPKPVSLPPPGSASTLASTNSLPALPSAMGGLPPLPALPGKVAPLTSTPSAPLTNAPSSTGTPSWLKSGREMPLPRSQAQPSLPAPSAPPGAVAAPTPVPAFPKTGDSRADELIEVAIQSRELNDADGALQALERADLIKPDHPIILREKAITYGKLGRADKAQPLWDRVSRMGPGAGTASSPPEPSAQAPTPEAPGSINGAFATLGGASTGTAGPLSLGQCQVIRDATMTKGEKVLLKIPLVATPGAVVNVSDCNLDVLFYDKVDEARLEPTNADPVTLNYEMPVDFKTSTEIVTATYHMPQLTSQEIANIGHRSFGGYVVKLYYKNRLMSTAASPRELLSGSSGQGPNSSPVANPLLPPLPK